MVDLYGVHRQSFELTELIYEEACSVDNQCNKTQKNHVFSTICRSVHFPGDFFAIDLDSNCLGFCRKSLWSRDLRPNSHLLSSIRYAYMYIYVNELQKTEA